jgi:hypothetical protein
MMNQVGTAPMRRREVGLERLSSLLLDLRAMAGLRE